MFTAFGEEPLPFYLIAQEKPNSKSVDAEISVEGLRQHRDSIDASTALSPNSAPGPSKGKYSSTQEVNSKALQLAAANSTKSANSSAEMAEAQRIRVRNDNMRLEQESADALVRTLAADIKEVKEEMQSDDVDDERKAELKEELKALEVRRRLAKKRRIEMLEAGMTATRMEPGASQGGDPTTPLPHSE